MTIHANQFRLLQRNNCMEIKGFVDMTRPIMYGNRLIFDVDCREPRRKSRKDERVVEIFTSHRLQRLDASKRHGPREIQGDARESRQISISRSDVFLPGEH